MRKIAKALSISRGAVRDDHPSGSGGSSPDRAPGEGGALPRPDPRAPSRCARATSCGCTRSWSAEGADISYPALTAFCRRHGIGARAEAAGGALPLRAGPGDAARHLPAPSSEIGGTQRDVQTGGLVLCYSRMLFFQFYPTLHPLRVQGLPDRSACATSAGAARDLHDRQHPRRRAAGHGRGHGPGRRRWRPSPSASASSSAPTRRATPTARRRVERPFHYIENNFLAGRTFADWDDLNRQARRLVRREATPLTSATSSQPATSSSPSNAPQLRPLPVWIPEVYLLHHRIVDVEGYVTVDTNRYSVPLRLDRPPVEVRETKQRDRRSPTAAESVTHVRHRRARAQAGHLTRASPRTAAQEGRAIRPEGAGCLAAPWRRSSQSYVQALRRARREILRICPAAPAARAWSATIPDSRCSPRSTRPSTTASTTSSGSSAWCSGESAEDFFFLTRERPGRTAMNDDLEQLLKNLHLKKIARDPRRGDPARRQGRTRLRGFLLRLAARRSGTPGRRRPWPGASSRPGCPSTGPSSPSPSRQQPGVNRRQIQSLRRARLHPQGREHRLHRHHRRRQDRARQLGLLLKALQNGYRGLRPAQDLFDEMYASLADRSTPRYLRQLSRIDVLVIDSMCSTGLCGVGVRPCAVVPSVLLRYRLLISAHST